MLKHKIQKCLRVERLGVERHLQNVLASAFCDHELCFCRNLSFEVVDAFVALLLAYVRVYNGCWVDRLPLSQRHAILQDFECSVKTGRKDRSSDAHGARYAMHGTRYTAHSTRKTTVYFTRRVVEIGSGKRRLEGLGTCSCSYRDRETVSFQTRTVLPRFKFISVSS